MQISPYIYDVVSTIDSDYSILFNTKNCMSFKYNNIKYKDINTLAMNSEIASYLIENEFLVPDTCLEKEKLFQKYREIIKEESVLQLQIFTHGNCNFRCTYCYENFSQVQLSVEKQDEIIEFVENELRKGKIENLSISWFGGEPLLGLPVIERMSPIFMMLADKYNLNYISGITTNGYLLTEKVVAKLTKLNITTYQITIDGPKDVHDKQRVHISGKGTFDRIMNNLIKIKEIEDTNKYIIRVNLSEASLPYIESFLLKMKSDFNDDRFIWDFHTVKDFNETFNSEINESTALQIIKKFTEMGGNVRPIVSKLMPQSVCYASKKNSYGFAINGSLHKCTVALYNEENILGNYGKIDMEMVSDKEKQWLKVDLKAECDTCKVLPLCWGNDCPWVRIKQGKPRCVSFKNNMEQMIEILELQDLVDASVD